MRFFLDTEFFEDGPKVPIKLISIGIVAESGEQLYVVNNDFNFDYSSDWLRANVKPNLMDGKPDVLPFQSIGHFVQAFISRVSGSEKPEFWGYYSDYDWVVFCQLFGNMVNLPKTFPMFCLDIKQYAVMLGNPKLPKQLMASHNALYDARWNKQSYDFLVSKDDRCQKHHDLY